MAQYSMLLMLSVSRKVEALLNPRVSFLRDLGWPVTSRAMQYWGRAVMEGWATLEFVEIPRDI
jgi:hypothetical protein